MDHSLVTYSNLGSLVQAKKITEITRKETLRGLILVKLKGEFDLLSFQV